jgi:sigma-B regulation protein RsbU (phosphoserine phosphatase)
MATTKTVIKDHLSNGEDTRQALNNINRQLCSGNSTGMFVTLWLGVLEISSGRLEYINAGHPPPLIKRGDGGFTFLVSPPDLALAGMDDTLYNRRETVLGRGDTLFLYTDGVTEAADSGGAFYGRNRLKNFLDANAALPLSELLPGLRSDIAAFTGNAEQWDDITMLALRVGVHPLPTPYIILKADIGELEKLNAFIGRELDAHWPQRVRNHIELAAEEIFVNISRYAYEETEKNNVTVECYTEPVPGGTTMILTFTDYGVPFDPTEITVQDINVPLEERGDGGLGLLIVKKTTDTIHYRRENGANRLVLKKSWQKEGQ